MRGNAHAAMSEIPNLVTKLGIEQNICTLYNICCNSSQDDSSIVSETCLFNLGLTEILTGSWIDLLSTDYQLKKHFSF